MRILDTAIKPVSTIDQRSTVTQAARKMREDNVGALVVTDDAGIVGIVTDRDITVEIVGAHRPLEEQVHSIMTPDPVTIHATADMSELLEIFRTSALRRVPVISDGELVGIIAIDDIIVDLAQVLGDVARPIVGETLGA